MSAHPPGPTVYRVYCAYTYRGYFAVSLRVCFSRHFSRLRARHASSLSSHQNKKNKIKTKHGFFFFLNKNIHYLLYNNIPRFPSGIIYCLWRCVVCAQFCTGSGTPAAVIIKNFTLNKSHKILTLPRRQNQRDLPPWSSHISSNNIF